MRRGKERRRNSERKTLNVRESFLCVVPTTFSILHVEDTISAEGASQYTDTVYLAVEEMPRSPSCCH